MSDYNPLTEGIVFDIQDFAVADGPGIRTVVFLKQCPLRCGWCSNPESQSIKKQILYYPKLCSGCGKCIDLCPENAIKKNQKFGLLTLQDKCTACGICVENCFYDARKIIGENYTVSEVLNIVSKNTAFYDNSGGGITVSGGEPFCQYDFTLNLLQALKRRKFNTALETSGYTDWFKIENTLTFVDRIFFDVKHIDEKIHIDATGVSNKIILDNLNRLAEKFTGELVVRIPFIPGFNGDKDVQQRIFNYLNKYSKMIKVEIMPYHRFGKLKYEGLGLDYLYAHLEPVKQEELHYLIDMGAACGLDVSIS